MSRSLTLLGAVFLLGGCHAEQDANRAALASPDPIRRAQAVQALAHNGDLDDLGYLMERVGDPDPLVRAAVAEGLGHLDDRHAADGLAELAEDGSEAVQIQAVIALGRMKVPRARSYLLLAYQRGGSKVRAQVAESLAASGASPAEAVEAEARALYGEYSGDLAGSGASRLTAAEELGHSGRPEAVERLVGYLGAESHALAIAAARGLGASGAPEARPPLEALLIEDDPDLQVAGAQALGDLGDPAAAAALSRTIQRGGRAAAAALGSLLELASNSKTVFPLLCDAALASDPDLADRAGAAVRAHQLTCDVDAFIAKLRRGGPESAGVLAGIAQIWQVPKLSSEIPDGGAGNQPQAQFIRPIADLLRTGPAEARPFAARAATSLGLEVLLPELTKAREDAETQIERARERWIKTSLPQLFTSGFADPHALAGPSHAQVSALLGKLDAIGMGSSSDDPSKLASLFSAPPASVLALWAEAGVAEVRFGGPKAAGLLNALLSDPSARVRRIAVAGVHWLPHDAQWGALTPLLDDADSGVREAAVSSVGKLDPQVPEAGRWLLEQVQAAGAEPDMPLGALIEALGHYPAVPGVTAALVAQLGQPGGAPAAIRGLVALGGPEAKAALLAALKAPRQIALDALLPAIEKLGDQSAIAPCQALLFDAQPAVRAAAVRALVALDGRKGASEVQVLAQDYDRRVRQAVTSTTTGAH